MTPADLAMKAAFDESAQYANSPPATAATTSHPNVTSLGPHFGKSSIASDGSSRPATPHITLHQFHKLQHSPAPTISPDIDYKRVRRKQSFKTLVRLPSEGDTSSSTLLHSKSESLLLPPLSLAQLPQTPAYSPSLSSTVDTLSTPTHSPIQRIFWPPAIEQGGLSEPIRTKRKFLPLKQAKRLPHPSAQDTAEESTWEVHAVVVDIGDLGDLGDLEQSDRRQVDDIADGRARALSAAFIESSDRRKGRLVRFEGVEQEESSSESESLVSPQSPPQRATTGLPLTSSLSLSKFQFPVPPGSKWEGTFGHLTEPTSPDSPATLHYRGVSFDVVNPHTSLLLGVSDFETPAEIDGLLDDYFDSGERRMQNPYSDSTAEKSASQYSLQTSASNGRQRVLYDNADSARRNIMGLDGNDSQQSVAPTASHGPEGDIPPMPSHPPPNMPLPTPSRRPATPIPFAVAPETQRRQLHIHPRFREVLELDTSGTSRVVGDEVNYDDLDAVPADNPYVAVSTHETHRSPALAGAQRSLRYDDRPNSLYPHSRRSYPFDLELDDEEDDLAYSSAGNVVAGRRTSHTRTRGDRGADFAIYQDEQADDANARTQSTVEQETTVGHILSHYNYPRPPSGDPGDFISPYNDPSSESASIGYARGERVETNPFFSSRDRAQHHRDFGTFQDQAPASQTYTPLNVTHARLREAPRVPGPPPSRAMPTPASRVRRATGWNPFEPELIATDQTYGSTGQLLRLTPQAETFAAGGLDIPAPITGGRPAQRLDRGFEEVPTTPVAPTRPTAVPPAVEDEDEDKENTPPQPPQPSSGLDTTPGPEPICYEGPQRVRGPATIVDFWAHLQRSPTVHRDDDSVWESTQASESRVNLTEAEDEPDMHFDGGEDLRPSEDSYANTSVAGSNVRLSLPRSGPAPPMPPAAVRRRWPELVHGTPGATTAHSGAFVPQPLAPSDEERARRILEDKMFEDAMSGRGERSLGTSQRDVDRHTSNMKELEAIRQKNPGAVEKAVKAVSEGIGKIAQMQSSYTPQGSTSTMPLFGLGRGTPDARYSETQGLLAEQAASPYSIRGPRFDETATTSQTARRMPSFLTSPPVQAYSPLTSAPPITPPATAHLRDFGNTPTIRRVGNLSSPIAQQGESIELQPISRRGRASRAAMNSQTELRPLQLAESTPASGPSGRLTDEQLLEAERTWSMRPGRTQTRTLDPPLEHQSGAIADLSASPDDNLPHFNPLMAAQDARDLPVKRVQHYLSRPYYYVCLACPITALIFACGGFDWKMRSMSGNKIKEMSPGMKKSAAQVGFPLGIILYTVLGVGIAMIITCTKPH